MMPRCLFLAAVLASLAAASAAPSPAATPSFEREVAAVLRTRCSGCHREGDAAGDLSMETFAALAKGGVSGPVFTAGNPAASRMLARLEAEGEDHMPPLDQPQLTAAEKAILTAWIAAGAPPPAEDTSILARLVVPHFSAAAGPKPVTALAVSPDGGRVVVASGTGLAVLAGDSPPVPFTGLPRRINAIHFSVDGTTLVIAGGTAGLVGEAHLRDAGTGALVRSFGGHRDLLYDAELSPDGTLLATAGYDRVIRLWQVATGELVRAIDVHTGAVFDLAWHPSGKLLASASADETVKLWRTRDGVRLDTLQEPQGEVQAVLFTPDGGHLIAAGRDKRIHLWKLVTLDEPGLNPALHARFAHEAPIVALALSADGTRLLAAAEDRTLSGWTVPDLAATAALPAQADVVAAIVARPAGGFLVGRMDGSLEPLDAALERLAAPSPVAPPAPGDAPGTAPAGLVVSGRIDAPGEADLVRFTARRGQPLVVDVNAARSGSKLDSRVEILHADGRPVERVVLQATRDSWFTFRGKDSNQSDDFRMHNWMEMELDEYLYAGGEVVKFWLYPRGPDSGFKVYPGTGTRQTFFDTTAITHALGEPAWIVSPLPAGSKPAANGLPVFPLFFENDDAANRRLGTDSRVIFTPPADGEYVARVTDVRGFGAERPDDTWGYTLTIRPPSPSFTAALGAKDIAVSPGSAREIPLSVTRDEGFDGPVRVTIENLPAGFTFHGPVEIEAGQERAIGLLSAAADAVAPDEAADKLVTVKATAMIDGREVVQELGTLGDLKVADKPKLTVTILDADGNGPAAPGEPLTFRIRPGETIQARVRAERLDFADRIELGGDDSGRNLPFACYVDNIGLNGLLIVEGQTEREFFITASPVAKPGRRLFHLRATADAGQCSPPAVLEVVPAE
jgi:WD40 repeat protein